MVAGRGIVRNYGRNNNWAARAYIRHQWLRDFPIFRRLSIAPVSGQPWEDFQLNHLVLAFLVAARPVNPIVSLQPYQFARDNYCGAGNVPVLLHWFDPLPNDSANGGCSP